MARTRQIKPGFFTNEDLCELEPCARLLFIGMWCFADCRGILEDRPRKLRNEILPQDDVDAEALVNSLAEKGFITRYQIGEMKCIKINGFFKHQKPHPHEQPSTLPQPFGFERVCLNPSPEIVSVDNSQTDDESKSRDMSRQNAASNGKTCTSSALTSFPSYSPTTTTTPEVVVDVEVLEMRKMNIPDGGIHWACQNYSRDVIRQAIEVMRDTLKRDVIRYPQGYFKRLLVDGISPPLEKIKPPAKSPEERAADDEKRQKSLSEQLKRDKAYREEQARRYATQATGP